MNNILEVRGLNNPDANIAYAVQPDVAVLDVDVKPQEGKHGDETLAALEAIHGALPDTVRSLTGGGGVQYFFMTDATLTPVNGLFDSIDLKTHGGYVILPPSQHISGRRYAWEVLNEPNDVGLATLPQWIIDARIAPKGTTVHTVALAKGAEGAKVYEGQRNDILFRLASSLRAKGLSAKPLWIRSGRRLRSTAFCPARSSARRTRPRWRRSCPQVGTATIR